MKHLKLGDIVLVHSDGFIGWAIRQVARGCGEKPTRVNHVGMITHISAIHGPMITEALATGVIRRPISVYAGTGVLMAIYRNKHLSTLQRSSIALCMENSIGYRYGFIKIVLHLLSRTRFGILWRRLFGRKITALCRWDGRPICSYSVALAYSRAAGRGFGVPVGQADPDDIDDYVSSRPNDYECVFPLGEYVSVKEGS